VCMAVTQEVLLFFWHLNF